MNIAVLQSGGPTSVLNASLVGIIHESRNRFGSCIGIHRGFEGLLHEKVKDLSTLTASERERLLRTPSAALGTSRDRPDADGIYRAIEVLQSLDVACVVGIGGNDTADSLARLERAASQLERPIRVAGLPKTIDNDLAITDHTLGFPSAARVIAAVARDALVDTVATSSQYPVKLIEVMGRNAGWLAASAMLWIPEELPQPLIAAPERPFENLEAFLDMVKSSVDNDGFSVVIVPETMRWANGDHVAGTTPEWIDAFGHPYFPSAGNALLRACSEKLGLRTKLDRPGSITRSSIDYAAPVDVAEAQRAGRSAVQALDEGHSGFCTVIQRSSSMPYQSTIEMAPLADIANVEAVMPDGMFVDSTRQISSAFREYALPLVGASTQDYLILDWESSR